MFKAFLTKAGTVTLTIASFLIVSCDENITEVTNIIEMETELEGVAGSTLVDFRSDSVVELHYINDDGQIVDTLEETTSNANGEFVFPVIAGVANTHLVYEVVTEDASLFGFATESPATVDEVTTAVYQIIIDIVSSPDGREIEDFTLEDVVALSSQARDHLATETLDLTDPSAIKASILNALGDEISARSNGQISVIVDSGLTITAPNNTTTPGAASLNLDDGSGETWDINSNGSIDDGTDDAYDDAFKLSIDDVSFPDQTETTIEDDREVVFGPTTMSALDITRKVYVDDTELDYSFVRFMETLTNNTVNDITVDVLLESNFGSDEDNDEVRTSSNFNTTLEAGDIWFTNHQDQSDPAIAFFFPGASEVSKNSDDAIYEYTDVLIPAMSTINILHWGFQKTGTFPEAVEGFSDIIPVSPKLVESEFFKGLTQEEFDQSFINFDSSFIIGEAGSVAPSTTVTIMDQSDSILATQIANSDGSFSADLTGVSVGDILSISTSGGRLITVVSE
jgi:hypothetical protein